MVNTIDNEIILKIREKFEKDYPGLYALMVKRQATVFKTIDYYRRITRDHFSIEPNLAGTLWFMAGENKMCKTKAEQIDRVIAQIGLDIMYAVVTD